MGRLRAARLSWWLARQRRADPTRPILGVALAEHLGDIVAAEPVGRYLRKIQPTARIVWVVRPRYRELVEAFEAVDDVFEIGCVTEWIRIQESGPPFDQLFDLQLHGRTCPLCLVRLEREPDRRRATIENYYDVGNLLEVFCRAGGLPVLQDRPSLKPPPPARAAVEALDLPGAYVAVHGQSNQPIRDWTSRGWERLVHRVTSELRMDVVEIGGESVVRRAGTGHVDLTGRTTILESAEVLRRARAFVGIDSGPAHLANAVGAPAVLLLGRYRSYESHMPYSGPWSEGREAEILRSEGPTASIEPDRVFEAVRRVVTGPLERTSG